MIEREWAKKALETEKRLREADRQADRKDRKRNSYCSSSLAVRVIHTAASLQTRTRHERACRDKHRANGNQAALAGAKPLETVINSGCSGCRREHFLADQPRP